jgi:pilus assembly protein CpaB
MNNFKFNKSWLLMSVSVLFGLTSAWAIQRHLEVKADEIEAKARIPQVVRIVAARDLSRSSVLQMDDLATHAFPEPWITADAISVEQAHLLLGKQLNVELKAGQLIHFANTTEKSVAALASRLQPGKRAITIPVDQINSLSGLLSPADVIDLFVTFEHQGKRVTSPLLTGVQVLATGRDLSSADGLSASRQTHFATVTLVTTPDEAVKLVAARQSGTLTAVLSHSRDDARSSMHANPRGGHLAGLLGMEVQPAKEVPVMYGDRLNGEELMPFNMSLRELVDSHKQELP